MTKEQLKKKIYDVLRKGYFDGSDDAVDVSDGTRGEYSSGHRQPEI